MKKHALLIGVEEYRDKMISRLQFARADAVDLAKRLKDRCAFDTVRVLADASGDDEPLLVNIVTAVRDMAAELREEDLFLFFFAGHGVEKDGHGYLMARDSLQAYPEHGSLSLELLRKTLERLGSNKRVLLLDACRNSPDSGRSDASNCMGDVISRDIVAAARTGLGTGTTTGLLSACRSGQRAYEWASKGHGVFTYYLLEGLDGAAWSGGVLDFKKLAGHAARQVRHWSSNTAGLPFPQDPWYEEFGDPEPILLAEGAAATTPPAASPTVSQPFRRGRIEMIEDPALHIETVPSGATVTVNGRQMGQTPLRLTLEAGDYRIRAEKEGYQAWERRIRFDASGDADLRIELTAKLRLVEASFPLTAEQAREIQRNAAEALGLPLEEDLDCGNGIKMKMILIPADKFLMGSQVGSEDEKPQHEVQITKPFYMGMYEVSVEQFRQYISASGYRTEAEKEGYSDIWTGSIWKQKKGATWRKPGFDQQESHPVVCVSWNDAAALCRHLTDQIGRVIHLPTEAQWEYACRAGSGAQYTFGDVSDGLTLYAWYDANSGNKTHPVGKKTANGWGLYDMHGNVWEWCSDWYGKDYYGKSPAKDPQGPSSGESRVWRGGCWVINSAYCRSAYRSHYSTPVSRLNVLGFRVILDL